MSANAIATDARTALLLTLADDELLTGHRHSHWTGVAPSLEEDLAFASIAQDEINHADVWYQLVVGTDRAAVDAIGFGRQPHEYRNAVLCERPPRDFAYTLARHFLYDHFDSVRLDALATSSDPDIGAVARKLLHEERFHLEHADGWVERIGRGGDDARRRLSAAFDAVFPEAVWLFEPAPGEDEAVASGLAPIASPALLPRWVERIATVLDGADLGETIPSALRDGHAPSFDERGGRHGVHSDDLAEAWTEMTLLYRAHPGARW